MKRVGFLALLLGLLCIPSYSSAEITAPTGVTTTEGTYSDRIIVRWDTVPDITSYEVWRDSYESCEGAIPCEPEFIYYFEAYSNVFHDFGDVFPYGQVFEYRIRACVITDEITNEYICSDFSLPAYGYVLEDAPTYLEANPPSINLSCSDIGMDCGGGGGGILEIFLKVVS